MSNEQNQPDISDERLSLEENPVWITPSLIEETIVAWKNLGKDLTPHEAETVLMSFAQLHDLIKSPTTVEESK